MYPFFGLFQFPARVPFSYTQKVTQVLFECFLSVQKLSVWYLLLSCVYAQCLASCLSKPVFFLSFRSFQSYDLAQNMQDLCPIQTFCLFMNTIYNTSNQLFRLKESSNPNEFLKTNFSKTSSPIGSYPKRNQWIRLADLSS